MPARAGMSGVQGDDEDGIEEAKQGESQEQGRL